MGGARNFAYYATEASLAFLAKRRVRMWFLLDRDERDDDEVTSFFAKLGSQAKVKVLSRREIENYLLIPRAIGEFIALKRELSGTPAAGSAPSAVEVQSALEKHADQLRPVVVGKRVAAKLCRPVYPKLKGVIESASDEDATELIQNELQRMSNQLQEKIDALGSVHRDVSESIERNWTYERMNVVQGDLLLDSVCSEFGVRFIKDADGARLAALLTKSEIANEIQNLLLEIVR